MTPIEEEIDYEGLPSNAGLGVRFSFYFLMFLLCSSCSFRLAPTFAFTYSCTFTIHCITASRFTFI